MKLILDKSFLQAEPRDCRRLFALADAGCSFVCIDTLAYEFCSGRGIEDWIAAQKKLSGVAEQVESWLHVADLMREELEFNTPANDPCDQEVSDALRIAWRKGSFRPRDGFEKTIEDERERREVDSAKALLQFYQERRDLWPDARRLLSEKLSKGGEVNSSIRFVIEESDLVSRGVKSVHGDPQDEELFVERASEGLGQEWLLYRTFKTKLALVLVLMARYNGAEIPEKEFVNTKLDLDYVDSLYFADGILTNETKGRLADLCQILYGNSKLRISSGDVDRCFPSEEDTLVVAYFRWLDSGCREGNDLKNWFSARGDLIRLALGLNQMT